MSAFSFIIHGYGSVPFPLQALITNFNILIMAKMGGFLFYSDYIEIVSRKHR